MEKLFGVISGAAFGWLGWLQKDKVSQSTCKAIHGGLCDKLDLMQKDLTLIKEHLIGDKSE